MGVAYGKRSAGGQLEIAVSDRGAGLDANVRARILPLQAKLLHVIERGAVRPIGGMKERPIDVRILAATNRDLEQAVRDGRFREDLLYRLNLVVLELPPLRERNGDLPELIDHFLGKARARADARDAAPLCHLGARAGRWHPRPRGPPPRHRRQDSRAIVGHPGGRRPRREGVSRALAEGQRHEFPVIGNARPPQVRGTDHRTQPSVSLNFVGIRGRRPRDEGRAMARAFVDLRGQVETR
ncbi:sigma 54-interacting transcriptional regulator [Nannocystis pusilla]|uniref:sigma 54-interacting transcriptional regulator n=1 Tax=Nannocystis pusilla TaxID=889268 RepID=UPI003BF3B09A